MNKKWYLIFAGLISTIILIFFLVNPQKNQNPGENQSEVILPELSFPDSFQRVTGPLQLKFPADMGAHPGYASEWWYYTGNLLTDDGRHFGYQLTFFRRAILPLEEVTKRSSDWATNDIFMAHFTLTDTENEEHYAFEKFSRSAVGLAGVKSEQKFSVWLNDWRVEQTNQDQYHLFAKQDGIQLDLLITDKKGVVLHGDEGLSQKGPQPGNASMYFSQTRLESEGTIQILAETLQVKGNSWMDHEYGTSALGADQIGWDWFSLQMDNQMEIMLFQIREKNGAISQYSSGSLINPAGQVENIKNEDFNIEVLDEWRTSDGVTYPMGWQISVPEYEIDLELIPLIKDQENKLSFRYWEGAIRVVGSIGGEQVSGYGYVEMTGYAEAMENIF